MAQIVMVMNALANFAGPEMCHGCKRQFKRGEQMNAVEYPDGSPAGWHCDECIEIWQKHGEQHLPRWEAEDAKETTGDGK